MSIAAPGVDIRYPTDGPPLIAELSTSVTAFVGPTRVKPDGSGAGIVVRKIRSSDEFLQTFGTPGANYGPVSLSGANKDDVDLMGHNIRGFFANGGSEAYVISTSGIGAATAVRNFAFAGTPVVKFEAVAASNGLWGNRINVKITNSSAANRVDVEVTSVLAGDDGDVVRTERYTAVEASEASITAMASQYVTFVAISSGTVAAERTLDLSAAGADMDFDLTGGADSSAPAAGAVGSAVPELEKLEDVSLIVLPNNAWRNSAPMTGNDDNLLMVSHAEEMQDRMVLVRIDDSVVAFESNAAGLPLSSYMAAYYPAGKIVIPLTSDALLTQTVGLIGHVAGVYARSDSQIGAWQSPAGLQADLRAVTELSTPLNRKQQAPMNQNGVNALRIVNGIQTVYGARTRDVGGLYQYVAVRRTAFLIGDSLRDALQRVVFARNIESTWQNVKTAVNGFLRSLFNRQAFQGATADEAFQVLCGLGESMTQTDIDNGKLIVRARFKAAKPAEFITVSIEQKLQGEI